jgi:hypothetical protein
MLIIPLLWGVGPCLLLAFLICDLTLASLACWIEKSLSNGPLDHPHAIRLSAGLKLCRLALNSSYAARGPVDGGKLDRKGTVAMQALKS